MQIGLVRSVNSSAIRLHQMQKAYEYYSQQSATMEKTRRYFIMGCLQKEIEDLKEEINQLADEEIKREEEERFRQWGHV